MSREKLATIADRLKYIRDVHRINKAEFARRLGISRAYASELESGRKSHVSPALAALIEKEFGLYEGWLTFGEGDAFFNRVNPPGALPTYPKDEIPETVLARLVSGDYAFIPQYDLRAAAGAGAVAESEEIVDFLVLNRAWIRQHFCADPAFLSFLYVDGDSMEPLLRPNEMILVDRSTAHAPVSGVYVIRLDGHLLVKRVMRCPGNVFIVKSENEAYRAGDFTVEPGDGKDFAVIGRVVWAGKSL